MAKSKSRKKKKSIQKVSIKPQNYIKKVGRKLPIFECWILDEWKTIKKTEVLVVRQKSNGDLVLGFYLVDLLCLGLKDSFFRIMDKYEYEETLEYMKKGAKQADAELIKCDPQLAFNVIYGAIEYAEDLGFSTPKDFRITEYLLDDVESIEFIDIEFGQNGKPHYESGPEDNVKYVLDTLNKNVGQENYTYTFHLDEDGFDGEFYKDKQHSVGIKEYLPQQLIDKKLKTLDEEGKTTFLLDVTLAEMIERKIDGDFSNFDMYYDEDEIYKEVLEEFRQAMLEMKKMEGEKSNSLSQELMDWTEKTVEWMFEKIREHSGVEFLLDKKFNPIITEFNKQDILEMSEKEFKKYEEELEFYMTEEGRFRKYMGGIALGIMGEKTNGFEPEILSEAIREEVEKEFEDSIRPIFEGNDNFKMMEEIYKEELQKVFDNYEKFRSFENN